MEAFALLLRFMPHANFGHGDSSGYICCHAQSYGIFFFKNSYNVLNLFILIFIFSSKMTSEIYSVQR